MWSVLFLLRRFSKFKSGRGKWTHYNLIPFIPFVPCADCLLSAVFWMLWGCLPGEFVMQTWAPDILRSWHPWLKVFHFGKHCTCQLENEWMTMEWEGSSVGWVGMFWPWKLEVKNCCESAGWVRIVLVEQQNDSHLFTMTWYRVLSGIIFFHVQFVDALH